MKTQNESHEDAFFRAGTEGTYEGGPGSLVPVELDDWVEAPSNVPTEEGLERRRKLRRVVVSVVTTLTAGLFLAAALRSAVGREGNASGAQIPASASALPAPALLDQGSVTEKSHPERPQATDDTRQVSTLATTKRAFRGRSPETPRQRPSYESGTKGASARRPGSLEPPTANFPDWTGHLDAVAIPRGGHAK